MNTVTQSALIFLLVEVVCVIALLPPNPRCQYNNLDAPNDFNSRCRAGNNRLNHIFPDNWKVLVDTYNYQQLFRPGSSRSVWESEDFDGDGNMWNQVIGGVCRWSLYTCSYPASQDNWLFSQRIGYHAAKEVFFNVTYRFDNCRDDPACSDDFVTLYRWDTNARANKAMLNDKSNYKPFFGDEMSSKLQQPPPPASIVHELHSWIRPPECAFYLGLKDSGTCGSVTRIIIYYTVCHGRQEGLVVYPEFATPPRDGPDEVFYACCVANAHNITSLAVNGFSENSTCSDQAIGGAKCECDAGYEISQDRHSCIACRRGFYRAEGPSSTCQRCPLNSVSNKIASPRCECLNGFFRAPGEGPDFPCTEPPTAPINCEISEKTDSTLTLSWQCPSIIGRTDYFYRLCYSELAMIEEEFCSPDIRPTSCRMDHTIERLKADTTYNIKLSSHNGVSDQDLENNDRRTVVKRGRTTEGVPDLPILKRLCTVVIWKPSPNPAGKIVGYELRFEGMKGEIMNFSADDNFHLTSDNQRLRNVDVQIRTRNSAAASNWTEPLPIDCNFNPQCPTSLPPPVDLTTPPLTTTHPPPTTSHPTASHPTTSPPTTSRPVATRGTLPPTTSNAMPPPTAPPPSTPPSIIPPTNECPTYDTDFVVNGVGYNDGDTISIDTIGNEESALICTTEYENCCTSPNRAGQFQYPNGTMVPTNSMGEGFYRNRGCKFIRLHRREGVTGPIGPYHCMIPGNDGTMVTKTINVIAPTPRPPVRLTTPPPTTPPPTTTRPPATTSHATTSPPPPTTPSPTTPLPTTPPPTTPPPITPPPTNPPPTAPPTNMCPTYNSDFILSGVRYSDGDTISINDIGNEESALICTTENENCCTGPNRAGQFQYPNGTEVPVSLMGEGFYRNRGCKLIRLHRREGVTGPTGAYRCLIPRNDGTMVTKTINVIAPLPPSTSRPPVRLTTPPPTTPPPATTSRATTSPPPPSTPSPTTPPPTNGCSTYSTDFVVNGVGYNDGDTISIDTIGNEESALICTTENKNCCTGSNRAGEFQYPNGTVVPVNDMRYEFYRNRGCKLIRLHRRAGVTGPTGPYRCMIPGNDGTMVTKTINVIA